MYRMYSHGSAVGVVEVVCGTRPAQVCQHTDEGIHHRGAQQTVILDSGAAHREEYTAGNRWPIDRSPNPKRLGLQPVALCHLLVPEGVRKKYHHTSCGQY
jgi:hypothetical protein